MNPQDVAAYLQSHPQFFEDHAELLASVQLTSPHSHRAVSLQQRQMEILREKNKGLELKLADLIRHGHENDRIEQRMHDWQLRLLTETAPAALIEAVRDGLQTRFEVPAVALRLWALPVAQDGLQAATPVTEAVRAMAQTLRTPYCGAAQPEPVSAPNAAAESEDAAAARAEALGWLGRDDIASLAMIALRTPVPGGEHPAEAPSEDIPAAFGLLVLGSHDPRRYHAGMGTAYLSRIGEVASAALSRLLR
ncbi:DUF484 family protein [Cupriavidus sp. AU9028]|uniref:DUF484 family protein n=1 Tax=Cupriavidus sp. AU9028 TaxID=2871157 RepID=UPI001C971F83|nr:DUF484 family protein [Cupriavidus sp. AU9028]MBY4896778.1 DUF484 family protein [Cupriavidus sp. AU9028]